MELLVQRTIQAAEKGMLEGRELANVCHGVACSSKGKVLGELIAVLTRAAQRHMHKFNAQHLANTAWAFAKLSQLDTPLLAALARAAERSMHEFNAQALANTAWAFAKLG